MPSDTVKERNFPPDWLHHIYIYTSIGDLQLIINSYSYLDSDSENGQMRSSWLDRYTKVVAGWAEQVIGLNL